MQETLARAARLTSEAPIIVCNEEHRFLVAEQCRAEGVDVAVATADVRDADEVTAAVG